MTFVSFRASFPAVNLINIESFVGPPRFFFHLFLSPQLRACVRGSLRPFSLLFLIPPSPTDYRLVCSAGKWRRREATFSLFLFPPPLWPRPQNSFFLISFLSPRLHTRFPLQPPTRYAPFKSSAPSHYHSFFFFRFLYFREQKPFSFLFSAEFSPVFLLLLLLFSHFPK